MADGRSSTSGNGPAAGEPGLDRDRAVLAAALDPIITIDASGTVQSASDSVERVLGWSPEELVGRNVNVLMPEPHHSAHDGYLANYHRTGQTNILNRPRRFDALHKDGARVPIELCVSRADVPGGPLFVGIIRDMSAYAEVERSRDQERVRYQQLLAEQTAALKSAHDRLSIADRMASIGTLAAGLGHDMNNVLLPVRARLNALRAAGEAGELPADQRGHVEEIRKSIAYLQQLADGLHFLALDPETEADDRGGGAVTDLRQWWSQAGTLLSKAVPKLVKISASFPKNLPPAGVAAHGLTQAVLNLVVNAGEAAPPERSGRVRIWADVVEDGALVRLGVTDNGSGMSEEVRRRAFELFYTTKPRGLGTGLGLALVRNVVERAGGRVEVETGVGKGTTVTMILRGVRLESEAVGADGPSALIELRDGRAEAMIRHLLESFGVQVRRDGNLADADLLVVDPGAADPARVAAWRGKRPDGRLVLLGPAGTGPFDWLSLNPVTIEDPDDLDAVRTALGRAVE